MADFEEIAIRLPKKAILALEEVIGHTFKNPHLLDVALTHSSAKTDEHPSNERMEFFGDAVLGLVVTELIYHRFPEFPEGEMTRIRSALVSRETLSIKAEELELHRYLLIGKGVGRRHDLPRSILANVFEAIVAALYVEAGYETCRRFLIHCFEHDINALVSRHTTRNYKSALQQLVQAHLGVTPTYEVLSELGPDHRKSFSVSAVVRSETYPPGNGRSKKEAEQDAARIALRDILTSMDFGTADDDLLLELPVEDEDEFEFGDLDPMESVELEAERSSAVVGDPDEGERLDGDVEDR